MWRLGLTAAALVAFAACSKKPEPPPTVEGPPPLASVISAGDPKLDGQFVRGVFGPEQNAWRWTEKNFVVKLRPPFSALEKGATLHLQFMVLEPLVKKGGPVTVRASVGGAELAPEKFAKAGTQDYTRDVPASALSGDAVEVSFTADKTMPPNAADKRELSLIITSVGLEAKN